MKKTVIVNPFVKKSSQTKGFMMKRFTNMLVTNSVSGHELCLFFQRFTNANRFTVVNLFVSHSENRFTILFPLLNQLMNGKKGFLIVETDLQSQMCVLHPAKQKCRGSSS